MNYFILWLLGFGSFWVGLKVFDDEVILIVSTMLGSILILAGLIASPPLFQLVIECTLVIALFNLCMQCIKRGNLPKE